MERGPVHENVVIRDVTPGDEGQGYLGFTVQVESDLEDSVAVDVRVTKSAVVMISGKVEDFVHNALRQRIDGYENDGKKLARLVAEQPHAFDTDHVPE